MEKRFLAGPAALLAGVLLPGGLQAQGLSGSLQGMQPVLEKVYQDMVPLCGQLIDVSRGIAGFGALWYIASRVWRQLAAAEAIDFYPLLRPFALGMAIVMFPLVMALFNGLLQPTVLATGAMVKDSNRAIEVLLEQKQAALKKTTQWQLYVGDDGKGDRERWYKYLHPDDPDGSGESMLETVSNDISFFMEKQGYSFRNSVKQWMAEVLEVLYAAAALCINVVRTFVLIVLTILGPLVLGFAVFDGFQQSLTVWIARYVNIFMWLPIANILGSILGKIQENMLKLDISQIAEEGHTFFSSSDVAYLIFMVIGIVSYFCVPTVANYIVHAGGGNTILQKVNMIVSSSSRSVVHAGSAGAGMAADKLGDGARLLSQGYAAASQGDYFPEGKSPGSSHQQDKLAGK
ncbi:conjugative transposon protein TraJ [Pedobacter namyangjuensis]|uniref:conjugative transposon protein TraJ n=1 Tax=Pedobacter namyangjuensis TaxID=600626 RepID=UPI000DE36216|nr:conjugative transposon protein TraJ [Pedobacter namyangjuensis]